MAMAQVVHANSGKVGFLCGRLHLLSHLVMCEGEDPFVRLDAFEIHYRAQLLFEEWRHLDYASGRARLGRARLVAASDFRDASPHHDDATIEVDVVARECEQLSQTQTAPIEDLERAVCDRVVLDLLCEGKVLCLRPEAHLLGLLLSHLAKSFHGVSLEPIEVGRMVQDCIELIVYRSEIGGRIVRAVLSTHGAHEVLPEQYVLSGELFDECRSQIRFDLVSEENGFIRPSICGDRGLDIAFVYSEELGKGQSPDICFGFESSLPIFRLLFRFEASLGCSFRCPVHVPESAG